MAHFPSLTNLRRTFHELPTYAYGIPWHPEVNSSSHNLVLAAYSWGTSVAADIEDVASYILKDGINVGWGMAFPSCIVASN